MVPKARFDNLADAQFTPARLRAQRGPMSNLASPLLGALAVGLGAALGAVLRWQLGVWLNASYPAVPPGTLVANVVGGYLVGLAVAFFAHQPEWPAAWKLFVITGFLGGLTTFSTFSAEVVALLQSGRLLAAATAISAHLAGSLLATVAGLLSYGWLRR
jgi:fluoride exporter